LAELYANGKPGVTIDIPKAVEFFKKSAQLNHAQASFWLAHYYQSLTDQSVENKIAAFNYFL
jgi:TPR repeat protein